MHKLAGLLALLITLVPVQANALGLGDIELKSALNQPFDAEIAILALGKTDLAEVNVALGSVAAFENAGVERTLLLTRFKFRIDRRDGGVPVIHITSRDSVPEPFLDFLIEVTWPNGQLVREYTVLLDPPVLLEEAPAPVTAPLSSQGEAPVTAPAASPSVTPQPMTRMAAPTAAPVTAAPAAAEATGARGGMPKVVAREGELVYGVVNRNETLWNIALQMRPDDSMSVQQVMMALLKSNPEAFYDDNINNLKAGYVLRIDDASMITSMSKGDAAREARRQYEQWLDAKQRRAKAAGQRPMAGDGVAASVSGGGPAGADGARLRLVVPDQKDVEAVPAGAPQSGASGVSGQVSRLREELDLARESAEVAHQENAELKQRLLALEDQIAQMQRLLSLKDDTLTAIQTGVSEKPPAQAGATGAATPPPAPDAAPPTASAPAPKTAPAPAAKPSIPPVPVSPPAQGPGLLGGLLTDPMVLGAAGGAVLLVAALAWLTLRRRRAAAELDQFTVGPTTAEDGLEADTDSVAAAGGAAAPVEETGLEDLAGSDDTGLDIIQAEEEEIDVLAEADVYLAYRRFDKAEELLKDAAANEPDRHELTLKLLEVYAASENADAFVSQAEDLKARLGEEQPEIWTEVVNMGKKLAPAHALFAAGVAATAAAADVGAEDAMSQVDDELSALESDLEDLKLDEDLADLDLDGDLDLELEGLSDESSEPSLDLDEPAAGGLALEGDDLGGTPVEASDLSLETASESDLPVEQDTDLSMEEDTDLTLEAEPESLSLDPGLSLDESSNEADDLNLAAGADFALEDPDLEQDTGAYTLALAEESTLEEVPDLGDPLASVEEGPGDLEGLDLSLDEGIADEPSGLDFEMPTADEAEAEPIELELGQDEPEPEAVDSDADNDLDWLANAGGDLGDETLDADADNDQFDDLLSGDDEVGTKLDLAKAYIDMGDKESARNILAEVSQDGNADQQTEANQLLSQIG